MSFCAPPLDPNPGNATEFHSPVYPDSLNLFLYHQRANPMIKIAFGNYTNFGITYGDAAITRIRVKNLVFWIPRQIDKS